MSPCLNPTIFLIVFYLFACCPGLFAESVLAEQNRGAQTDLVEEAETLCLKLFDEMATITEAESGEEAKVAPSLSHRKLANPYMPLKTDVLPAIKKGDWYQAALRLRRVPMPQVSSARTTYQSLSSRIQACMQAEKDAVLDQFARLEAQVRDRLPIARLATELDSLISEVNELEAVANQTPGWESNERPNTGNLRQLLSDWQDFLFFKESGKTAEARQKLQRIEGQLSRYSLLPRSVVLGYQHQLESSQLEAGIIVEMENILTNLDDSKTYGIVLEQLRDLYRRSERNHRVSSTVRLLEELQQAHLALTQGNLILALELTATIPQNSFGKHPEITSEADRIARAALAAYMQPQLAPEESENGAAFIMRAAETLGKEARWQELWEFLSLAQIGRHSSAYGWLYNELNATSKLVSGLRFEAAGDFASAYGQFTGAIGSVCRFSQDKGAQAGIERILKDHAEAVLEAKLLKEKLKVYRELVENEARNHPGFLGRPMGEDALHTLIEETAKEVIASHVVASQKESLGVDPFRTPVALGADARLPRGDRFHVTYLDEADQEKDATFRFFSGDNPDFLRIVEQDARVPPMIEDIARIRLLNPVSKEEMQLWPKRYENRKDIHRSHFELTFSNGSKQSVEIYSTLYFTFSEGKDPSFLKLHPCRVLMVERVE
jgi:hypothetical protein